MKKTLLLVLTAFYCIALNAQLLSWTPAFPKEDDAAQTFVITVDASKGNMGLLNHATTDVYVHTGVITNLSANSSDWKYVKFSQNFNLPNAALQAVSIGGNKWQFTINGSLKAYYGVSSAETIQKIAILFRSGNGAKKQANSDGSDMYIPVYANNLAVRIDQPFSEPRFKPVPEAQTWAVGTQFTINGKANRVSDMKLYHNNVVVASQVGVQTITGTSTITNLGNQQIVVEANEGGSFKYDTINVFVSPASSPIAELPAGLRDGINYEPGNTAATLVLSTPAAGKNIVTLIGDFNNWTADINYIMNKTADGKKFWFRLTGLTPGVEYAYQYKVDDNLKIADPYAQKILDPYNNNDQNIPATTFPNLKPYPAGQTGIVSVLQTNEPGYTWTVNNFSRPDKRGLIIYELLLRDFVQAHDWKTLKDTLSYLKTLGVNAIELLPFNEFEGNQSWGYNPDFYFAPDKYYGPKNSLKEFIDHCHANGIAVIMDIALNHSFGLSPMVQLYFDGTNNRPAANNPWYNPEAKHPFNVGYDFNHESLDTRAFTSRVVEHWLQEYKIDGFRFDLSKGFTQINSGSNVGAWGNYDASRIAIWKRYYDTTQLKSPGSYAVLEHFADNSEEKELSAYGMLLWGNMNGAYQEAAMGYLQNSNFDGGIYTSRGWTDPHLVTFMESHDEERLMVKNINFGNATGGYNTRDTTTALKRMEMNGAFLFTIPGPKMLWQFGEVGYDYSINYCPNGTVNNNCRVDPKPIRWDYRQQQRRKNLYDVYSKLINLRFHNFYKNAFLSGNIDRSLGGGFKWIKVSSGDTSHLMVIGNFDVISTTGTVTFPTAGTWYDYLNNSTFTATGSAQTITLQPGQYHVYLNRNVNNTATTPIFTVPQSISIIDAKVFPNPIKAGFTVKMDLPQSGATKIELLNSVGQYITTLHQSFKTKGSHTVTLDRETLNIPAGKYYFKITNKTTTKVLVATLQ